MYKRQSLFSYDMSANIFKSFCELWCHTTNTFCTESGDMSISLWGMWVIGDFQLTDLTTKKSFHPPENSLLQDRTMNSSRLVPSSFQHSTDYAKISMASFSLPLQSGYASGFAGHRFILPLPNVTTGNGLKLPRLHLAHLAQLFLAHREQRGRKIHLLPSTFHQH